MKRSIFLLASLAISSALYAQAEEPLLSREQVLDFFAQYNPAVLERAQQDARYQALVDGFVQTFQGPDNLENRFEILAAVRNFDNSIRLHGLTERYTKQAVWAQMASQESAGLEAVYRKEVQDVMSNIYGVTVQANEWKLQELKRALKQLKKEDLPLAQKQTQLSNLKAAIEQQKQNVRSLKKNAGEMVTAYTEQQVATAKRQAAESLVSSQRGAAQEDSAKQSSNLQIKTNHKKPVAK